MLTGVQLSPLLVERKTPPPAVPAKIVAPLTARASMAPPANPAPVGEDDGLVVGHILFSRVTIQSNQAELTGIGLAPLTVLPERQNQRIGSMLIEEGLRRCREEGYRFVVVLGHPGYYPRFGFVPASRLNVKSEYNVADEVFMAMELAPGALSGCAGLAKYQPEFNEV